MNYEEALNFIHSTYTFGEKIGLENIQRMLDYLDNPHKGLKFIHIAGTNGKGSTSTMLSYILREAGYNTGLYISPYLEEFTERIQLNNEPIDRQLLADLTETVKAVVERIDAEGHQYPSEFEVVTAIAMLFYKKVNADVIVLETGMGGRFDATNIIEDNEAAVITSISYDHMLYLGDTLEEIAFEKAGIIKPAGSVSLYCEISGSVLEVFQKKAAEMNAEIRLSDTDDIELISSDIDGQIIRYKKADSLLGLDELRLSLLGDHQIKNVLNVLTACEILKSKGYALDAESIKNALGKVRFTGRFEVMHKSPVIVIDGGHNIEGINSFVGNIERYFEGRKVNLFYGMLNDKQIDESLMRLTKTAKAIYTLAPFDKRAVPAEEMAQHIRDNYPHIETYPLNSFDEIADHIDFSAADEIYAFTGSLYMIGEARTKLTEAINKHYSS